MTISSPDSPPTEVPEAGLSRTGRRRRPAGRAEDEPTQCPRTSAEASREVDDADLVERETVVYGEDDDLRG